MKKLFSSHSMRGNSDVTVCGHKVDPAVFTTSLQGLAVVLLSTGLLSTVIAETSTVYGVVAMHDLVTGDVSVHTKGRIIAKALSTAYADIDVGMDAYCITGGKFVDDAEATPTPVLGTYIAKGITGVMEDGTEIADCVELELK